MLNRERTNDLRAVALEHCPVVLYTGSCLSNSSFSQSATSLLRHMGSRVLAVVDEREAGATLTSVTGFESFRPVPIVRHPSELGDEVADMIIAMDLPPSTPLMSRHRREIVEVADSGRRVWNCLDEPIRHPMVRNLRSVDLGDRRNLDSSTLQSSRLVCFGTSAAAPPLELVLALRDELSARGHTVDWLPTSPAGMLLRGYGRSVEGAAGRHGPSIIEQLVMGLEASAATIVIEGSGSLLELSDAAISAAVAAGARSQFHVICHRPDSTDDVKAELLDAADRCDAMHRAAGVRSRLIALSLDTGALAGSEKHRARVEAQSLGVPCVMAERDRSVGETIDVTSIVAVLDALNAGVSG